MIDNNLLMSLTMALFSIIFFKLHKEILKNRDTTSLNSNIVAKSEVVRRWIVFVILVFLSLGYLLKFFKLL